MTIDELRRHPLPGDERLTVADLAEVIAEEYLLHPAQILFGGRETRERQSARNHLWGAMRGAGFDFVTIAEMWNVDPTRVRNGVILRSKSLGIEPPRGIAESGRNRRRRREHVGPSPRSTPS